MSNEHILVVDDEPGIREALKMVLDYAGYRVSLAADGKEGLKLLDAAAGRAGEATPGVDLLLLDIKMPGMDGLQVLGEVKKRVPSLEVVMISGHADVQTAIEATRRGAFDLLQKPLDQDRVLLIIRNALERSRLARDNRRLARDTAERYRLLGESQVMQELRRAIETAAAAKARVFITGENGTGKELIARAIHTHSPRAAGPFVEVNCAAIPKELIESELFGHVKGAFTGADRDRPGKFEQADGGTLFLDEIGDMPLDAQAKVLRVLEEEKVQRVGSAETRKVDVRVVAATNRDVEEMIAAGEFREDLYYRICVVPLHAPPLREHAGDVALLAREFLASMCDRNNVAPKTLTARATELLAQQPWPGNVRQLRNLMERLAIMAAQPEIDDKELARFLRPTTESGGGLIELIDSIPNHEQFLDEAERRYLQRHLEKNAWNIKHTAELLGMQRSNLYKKIEKHALR